VNRVKSITCGTKKKRGTKPYAGVKNELILEGGEEGGLRFGG